jgi:CRISPR-associated endonuclease/helicase Cas3
MDSIVQSAGRCNRNHESDTPAPVYVLNCADESLRNLDDIKRAQDATNDLLAEFRQHPEKYMDALDSDSSINYYYRSLYRNMKDGFQDYTIPKKNCSIFSLLSTNDDFVSQKDADNYFLNQAFKLACENFEVYDNYTEDVIVPYGEGKKIIENLCSQETMYNIKYRAEQIKLAKPYTVAVYDYQKKQLGKSGIQELFDGSVLVLQPEFYDEFTGFKITKNDMDYMEVN